MNAVMVTTNLASPWKRLGAALIDGLVVMIIFVSIMSLTGVLQQTLNGQPLTLNQQIALFVGGWIVFLIWNGYLLYHKGQTKCRHWAKYYLWLLIIFMLGLTACAGLMTQNELITSDQFEGVIFAQEDKDHWTPSRAEVMALEERLGPYVRAVAPQDYPGPLKNLSAYKRQYQGLWVKEQRVIAVNFFCNARGVEW